MHLHITVLIIGVSDLERSVVFYRDGLDGKVTRVHGGLEDYLLIERCLNEYEIELKYSENTPVIRTIERVSRPGRRVYVSVKNIPSVANGLGVSILSTPKGVMADHEAKSQNLGGEVVCRVF